MTTLNKLYEAQGKVPPNYDAVTKIHFGIISQNSLDPNSIDDIYTYGDDIDFEAYKDDIKVSIAEIMERFPEITIAQQMELKSDIKEMLVRFCVKIHDLIIDDLIQDLSADITIEGRKTGFWDVIESEVSEQYQNDTPTMQYEARDYVLRTDDHNDLWVIKSPFYTMAPECSPCAPNAGHLDSAAKNEGSLRTYCLGGDYFESGIPSYPVFRVEKNTRIYWVKIPHTCPHCRGLEFETLDHLMLSPAFVEEKDKDLVRAIVKNRSPHIQWLDDERMVCYLCNGFGDVPEVEMFDMFEFHPCVLLDERNNPRVFDEAVDKTGWTFEMCNEDNPMIVCWSVYGHLNGGGLRCLADFSTKAAAEALCGELIAGEISDISSLSVPRFIL